MSIFKDIIATVAPVLGTALGGPLGGAATKMVLNKLGVETEDDAVKVLESNPDAMLKLKQAEYDFTVKMKDLGLKEADLHQKDRDSARRLAGERGIQVQAILTGVFLAGYFGLMYLFFPGDTINTLGEWTKGQLGVLVGVLTAAVPQMLNFWFGSSEGSKRKTMMRGEN